MVFSFLPHSAASPFTLPPPPFTLLPPSSCSTAAAPDPAPTPLSLFLFCFSVCLKADFLRPTRARIEARQRTSFGRKQHAKKRSAIRRARIKEKNESSP